MPDDISPVIQAIYDNFSIFIEEVIGLNNATFHDELDAVISNPLYKNIAIAISRGHGKSTHLSVGYPLWEIAKNHNVRIMIVSSTATIASGFLTEVLNHIEDNEKYKTWAKLIDPQHKGVAPKKRKQLKKEEKWTSNAITIDRENISMKDPTIQTLGLFGSILSKRADIIIVDDLVNQQNSETEEQRMKIKEWVYTTLMPCLVPGGRFIYLGNTWKPDDLVAELLVNPQFDYKKRLPAIEQEAERQDLWQEFANILLNEDLSVEQKKQDSEAYYSLNKEDMDRGARVLWPERFSYSWLYMKRLENSYSFSRMYQCDTSTNPNQKIKEEWIARAVEKGKNLVLQNTERAGVTVDDTTSGLDLAISQKKGSDDTVMFTLDRILYGDDVLKKGDYVVRNIVRGKLTPNETRELVRHTWEVVKPYGIRVESVAYQQSLLIDLGEMGIPVRGYHTGGEKNDPEIGVNSIAILLEQGKLVIPYSQTDARTLEESSKLINELRAWPDGHTGDSLMAFWFALSEMRDHRRNKFTIPTDPVPTDVMKNIDELERMADQDMIKESEVKRKSAFVF